jgi:hypothetical protein
MYIGCLWRSGLLLADALAHLENVTRQGLSRLLGDVALHQPLPRLQITAQNGLSNS